MGPFHWKNRFLRIKEIKRIQSFEDKHIFLGNFREQWRQVGNAVPPKLANVFAEQLMIQYFNNYERKRHDNTRQKRLKVSSYW